MADSGLGLESKLVLYCRPTFIEQFKFLQEDVIEQNHLGWILGPPGTGKSTTTLAFASTLDKTKWTVTWIHLSRVKMPVVVRFENGEKKTRTRVDTSKILDILDEIEESKNHIVFVDGYVLSDTTHADTQKRCDTWLEENRENRRLVIVCSMSSRGKTKEDEDTASNVKEFFVYSWTLEEYQQAAQNKELFNHIKGSLDSSYEEQSPQNSSLSCYPVDLINSKFYFAGGSCRFMFYYKTAEVTRFLKEAIAAVGDIAPYIKGHIGHSSNHVINRLFSIYHRNDKLETRIVSGYATFQFALSMGPIVVENLADALKTDRNPSMDGWLFEMLFFARLRTGGVKLYNAKGDEKEWAESRVNVVDIKLGIFPSFSEEKGMWLKPQQWNQGGYDAIFIDKSKGLVRLVQITNSEKHSFKIEFFAAFLTKLRDSPQSFEIRTLEIVFVVDRTKLDNFQFSEITGQGLLSPIRGWEKDREMERIELLSMPGL